MKSFGFRDTFAYDAMLALNAHTIPYTYRSVTRKHIASTQRRAFAARPPSQEEAPSRSTSAHTVVLAVLSVKH